MFSTHVQFAFSFTPTALSNPDIKGCKKSGRGIYFQTSLDPPLQV